MRGEGREERGGRRGEGEEGRRGDKGRGREEFLFVEIGVSVSIVRLSGFE